MMKRSRGETNRMQPKKVQEEPPTKSQRRYKSPKQPHNAPKTTTEDNSPTTAPVAAIDSTCTEHPELHIEVPLYADGDDLSGLWSCAVEQDELSGWYPFVDGHFGEFSWEEEGLDLNLWRHDVIQVPN